MKQKMLVVASAVLLGGGALFGFTGPAKTADCPLKGTPECPLVKACPDKGTAALRSGWRSRLLRQKIAHSGHQCKSLSPRAAHRGCLRLRLLVRRAAETAE